MYFAFAKKANNQHQKITTDQLFAFKSTENRKGKIKETHKAEKKGTKLPSELSEQKNRRLVL